MLAHFKKHIGSEFQDFFISRLAVAISGGKDSTVLAHLLHQFHIKFDLIHCNFNLRGEESDGDQLFVENLAEQFDCNLHVESFDTEQFANENKISTQMAARDLRYEAFNRIATDHDYDCILVAHHMEDQLETFLINLGRGAGLHGLTGIKSRNGKLFRPLLPFSREQLDDFATTNNIQWREDSSNASTKYQRNKLRHDVIPLLHDTLPHLRSNFSRTLKHLKDSERLIDVEVSRFRESGTETINGNLSISIEKLKAAVKPEAYLFELLKDHNFNLPDALQLLDGENGKYIKSGEMQLIKERGSLVLQTLTKPDSVYIIVHEPSGMVEIDDVKINFRKLIPENALEYLKKNKSTHTVLLDETNIQMPLVLRTWKHGDRMQPYGMNGSKLISDILTDGKISSLKREKALVLTSGNDIIWLVGKRASKHHKITNATKSIIEITLDL